MVDWCMLLLINSRIVSFFVGRFGVFSPVHFAFAYIHPLSKSILKTENLMDADNLSACAKHKETNIISIQSKNDILIEK